MNFCIDFSVSANNHIETLLDISLNLQIAFGNIAFFTILILPMHEHGFPSSGVFFNFFLQGFIIFIIEVFKLLY
jgi:hypothetical protein